MRIAAVGHAFPDHYYDQAELIAAFKQYWSGKLFNLARLDRLHKNVLVGGRHLALTIPEYEKLESWGQANDAWIRVATDLGTEAVRSALDSAGVEPERVGALFFVSVTGISTPSIDARIVNRLGLAPTVKRVPIFGLGCVAGAAGIARTSDYLRGFPDEVAVLLSVELCSLTLQRKDFSVANLISSGLFGDGAAAVVLDGQPPPVAGPRVVATRSVFYPDSEDVMGWNISERGFEIVLSPEVPEVVEQFLRRDVDAFLADHGLDRSRIARWVAHSGGPKVLEAMETALEVPREALGLTWKSLREVGNLSSASVLLVLEETLEDPPAPGEYGVLFAMGPGFCSELVLLQW